MRRVVRTFIVAAAVTAAFGALARNAEACKHPFPKGVGGSLTQPDPIGLPDNYRLTIYGGTTFGTFDDGACGCLIGIPKDLQAACPVTAVSITNEDGTTQPLGSFDPGSTTTKDSFLVQLANDLAVDQDSFDFLAFASQLSTAAAAGINLQVNFDLACIPNSFHDPKRTLAKFLKNSALVCTGPLLPGGAVETTDPTHVGCSKVSVNSKCQIAKKACVGAKVSGLLGCHRKAEKALQPLDPACVNTIVAKFTACVAKAEAKGPCLFADSAPALEAKVDAFILDVVQELDPSYPVPGPVVSNCTASKKLCVAKKAKGLLSCHAKAEKKPFQSLDPACVSKYTTKFEACFVTAEAKGDCLSVGDTNAIEAKVDAFVTDAVCAIDPSDPDVCPKRPICGDNIVNTLDEECDGTDDAACPGLCGSSNGLFPCLCQTIPRERVTDHANADLDIGWSGQSHDARVPEGGGYLADLYDCDGPGGPDTLCIVGPSCSGAPHSPCSNDTTCSLLSQGSCRKRRTAAGPYCNLDVQQACTDDNDCPGAGNFCVKKLHGPPLPHSAGGVSVCVVNTFSEDIIGTRDLATGATAVRLRQRAKIYLGPTLSAPCPLCGGFCGDQPLGPRNPCSVDADCLAGPLRANNVPCITSPVCSSGASMNRACRPSTPFGGTTPLFGTTSVDCLPEEAANLSSAAGLDILQNPLTTGGVDLVPSVACDAVGFTTKRCSGGVAYGSPCAADSDCPGALCLDQCFCPTGGSGAGERPNDCDAACLGGGNDAAPCIDDSECPGAFCHPADCRDNPLDPDGPNEGICTVSPVDGACSTHTYVPCNSDPDCASPDCPFCDAGETCVLGVRQCFLNSGIVRVGTPDPTNPVTVSAFCEARTSSPAVNNTRGLPGPAAIEQPTSVTYTGF